MLDITVMQWGAGPAPGAAGWTNVTDAIGPSVNVTHLNADITDATPGSRWLRYDNELHPSLRSRRASTTSNNAPQPCSGALRDAINANRQLPLSTSTMQSRPLDSAVFSVMLASVNGSAISTWPSNATVLIFIPFASATELTTNDSAVSYAPPPTGISALKAQFPPTVVSFRCPDSATGANQPALGSAVNARFTSPLSAFNNNATAWVSAIIAAPTTITPGNTGPASATSIASSVDSSIPAQLVIYIITVDCGPTVGFANATCAIDSATGTSLDVSFTCPAIKWTPACG